jgi:hypothetical protein
MLGGHDTIGDLLLLERHKLVERAGKSRAGFPVWQPTNEGRAWTASKLRQAVAAKMEVQSIG